MLRQRTHALKITLHSLIVTVLECGNKDSVHRRATSHDLQLRLELAVPLGQEISAGGN